MHRLVYLILIGVLPLLVLQCNRSGPVNSKPAFEKHYAIGQVNCLHDSTQAYWIAQPSDSLNTRPYPVIFVFDPHGDGSLAVKTFVDGMNDFDVLVAGSSTIRNGYPDTEQALAALVRDVYARYRVDRERVYAAGFSGGGRVAQLFSQLYPETRALASFGAGYSLPQPGSLRNKPSMLFAAGNGDFNYTDVMNAQQILAGSGIQHAVLEFSGPHEWPGPVVIRDVLVWFELDAIRRNQAEDKEGRVEGFRSDLLKQAQQYKDHHRYLEAKQAYEKGIAFLSGVAPVGTFRRKLSRLKKTAAFQEEDRRRMQARSLEIRLQQGYIAGLKEQDTLWWESEIAGLNKQIEQTDDLYLKPVYMRIKAFLSMAAYSFCNTTLSHQDLKNAERFIAVYRLIDPQNPDGFYFKALLEAKQGNTDRAIREYQQAVRLGFSDLRKARLELPASVLNAVSEP